MTLKLPPSFKSIAALTLRKMGRSSCTNLHSL